MIPQKIQALFDFIDFLDNNKTEYIEKYVPLCDELMNLHNQRNELKPDENYKDRQRYDITQNQIAEKFSPITLNVCNPISDKLREFEIWSGDKTYASIWNNNYPTISDFKMNFTSDDIEQVMHYKRKYLGFRTETNTDFLCLTFAFQSLDDILKTLFDFFKDTNENEFDGFETKTIKVNNLKEAVGGLMKNKGKGAKFSIPTETLYESHREPQINSMNIKSEIIMGDKIQIGNISDTNGAISIGKGNKTKVRTSDKMGEKSFHWQKWGIITATILAVIAIVVTIIVS